MPLGPCSAMAGMRAGWAGWGSRNTARRPVFNAQLEITYADGTQDIIATDDSWKAGPGEIIGSDAQWGEVIDARKAVPDWDQPSFTSSSPRDSGAGRGPRRGAALQSAERELSASSPRPSPPLRGREGDTADDSINGQMPSSRNTTSRSFRNSALRCAADGTCTRKKSPAGGTPGWLISAKTWWVMSASLPAVPRMLRSPSPRRDDQRRRFALH